MFFVNYPIYIFLFWNISLALSGNLVSILISLVGINITFYSILAKGTGISVEACLKYFLSSSLITSIFLFSIFLYYVEFGNFAIDTFMYNYNGHCNRIGSNRPSHTLRFILSGIFSTLFFKLGCFPFHYYIADLYHTLGIRLNMYIYSVTLKISILVVLMKIVNFTMCLSYEVTYPLFLWIGYGSVFVGAYYLLSEISIRRFFAYSYIISIGYTLLGFSALPDSSSITIIAFKFYFFIYLISWHGILHFFDSTRVYSIGLKKISEFRSIAQLGLLFPRVLILDKKVISLLCVIASLMGLPPTLGFFAKAYVYVILTNSTVSLLLLVCLLAISPLVAIGYANFFFPIFKYNHLLIKNYRVIDCNSNYLIRIEHAAFYLFIAPLFLIVLQVIEKGLLYLVLNTQHSILFLDNYTVMYTKLLHLNYYIFRVTFGQTISSIFYN